MKKEKNVLKIQTRLKCFAARFLTHVRISLVEVGTIQLFTGKQQLATVPTTVEQAIDNYTNKQHQGRDRISLDFKQTKLQSSTLSYQKTADLRFL